MIKHHGLSEKEAKKLLDMHGQNRIHAKKKTGAFKILASQFQDALIMILLASTLLSLFMGEFTEAITISAIVVLNALLGFIQEFKTEKTLQKLGELAAPTAIVIRDGQKKSIDASMLVPGDVVVLEAGDRIPADGLLLEISCMTCDESMLSGESVGVEKSTHSGSNAVYMGTIITQGRGIMRVAKTGANTEMGKIAGMLSGIEVSATPLQKRLAQLSKYIGIGCLVICAVVAGTGILRGEPVFDMFLTGISLSVAAVPEGLPAIVTIALALSVSRMVKRRALVRRLHAVETLGCANIICSDKTGTLTENRMTVKRIELPDHGMDVSGTGLSINGEFSSCGHTMNPSASVPLMKLCHIATLCNNATLTLTTSRFRRNTQPTVEVFGEPTETALLILAVKANVKKEELPYEIVKEIPFDSTRKMMSVQVQSKDGGFALYSKGAPDILLSKCSHVLTREGVKPLTNIMRQKITAQNNRMAESALRVLGFAYSNSSTLAEENMIFVGLTGLLDPPRREAYDAVKKCRAAGIRPVMITGDHAITAKAIAQELKIYKDGDRVVTGTELSSMDDETLQHLLPSIAVFARVTPAHKLRIVKAFKSTGNIVAMTGDGVNDAPAVKEADIGVSMGITGTDVTKEAASVILLDDNFATLVSAVEEGRIIYQNIRKFIRYLLSCNIGEVVTMFFAMLCGMPIPLIPIQILLINLITDGLPAIALSLEPAEPDVMNQPPRGTNESVFSRGLAGTIIIRGLLIGFTTLAVFHTLLHTSGDLACARTGALLALVTTQLIHVFECKSETRGLLSIPLLNNKPLLLAVCVSVFFMYMVLYNPFFANIFRAVPLSGEHLLIVLAYCATVPLLSSMALRINRRRHQHPPVQKKYGNGTRSRKKPAWD